jgi:hypothetical protein
MLTGSPVSIPSPSFPTSASASCTLGTSFLFLPKVVATVESGVSDEMAGSGSYGSFAQFVDAMIILGIPQSVFHGRLAWLRL